MPFGKYETPKLPPVPTFLQYLKSCSKSVEGKTRFAIDIIWLPGKFDNVTLQTHAFRYVCDSSHPLYTEMQEYVKDKVSEGSYPRVDIVIDSIEAREVTLSENPKAKGSWEKLGSNALKFKSP